MPGVRWPGVFALTPGGRHHRYLCMATLLVHSIIECTLPVIRNEEPVSWYGSLMGLGVIKYGFYRATH